MFAMWKSRHSFIGGVQLAGTSRARPHAQIETSDVLCFQKYNRAKHNEERMAHSLLVPVLVVSGEMADA